LRIEVNLTQYMPVRQILDYCHVYPTHGYESEGRVSFLADTESFSELPVRKWLPKVCPALTGWRLKKQVLLREEISLWVENRYVVSSLKSPIVEAAKLQGQRWIEYTSLPPAAVFIWAKTYQCLGRKNNLLKPNHLPLRRAKSSEA
jgi:hypothetical protein